MRCGGEAGCWLGVRLALPSLAILVLIAAAPAAAVDIGENIEIHGEFGSYAYFRSPNFDLSREFHMTAWQSELELDLLWRLRDTGGFRAEFRAILKPSYDAVYDLYPEVYGKRTRGGAKDSSSSANQSRGIKGRTFPGSGACISWEFCLGNQDNQFILTGSTSPGIAVNPILVGNAGIGPVATEGSRQLKVGGAASASVFSLAATGATGASQVNADALQASLDMASKPLSTPLNFYAGGRGNRSSLDQLVSPLNDSENDIKFGCTDITDGTCLFREFFLDLERGNSFLRLGRQIVAWGKTDAFQLQDVVNPIDLGIRNIFPDLDERRIPVLAARFIQGLGARGPFDDVQAEAVWVVDRFTPKQIGQCGEAYAFMISCQLRLNASNHSSINLSLAEVEERHWTLGNTEPGARLELYLPDPAITFSFSAFWGFQDTPVLEAKNLYSASNPNPAAMLRLQAEAGDIIDALAGDTPADHPWVNGFDPYSHDATGAPTGTLDDANQDLIAAWQSLLGGVAGSPDPLAAYKDLEASLEPLGFTQGALALPWSGSELAFKYPRVLTVGGSMDYDWVSTGSVLRAEFAYDVDRHFTNTAETKLNSSSDVFKLAVGVDRPTVIPFLNRDRAAWISVQVFWQHIIDYDDGAGHEDGIIEPENGLQSTFIMRNNFWDDALVMTTFAAVDWNRTSIALGPKLAWNMTDAITLEMGMNFLFGRKNEHGFRNVCADGGVSCIGDPTTWMPGQYQVLNRGLVRSTEAPFFPESFADRYMEQRDELWFGIKYAF